MKGTRDQNDESQNTDAQGMRAPATTLKLCALWTLKAFVSISHENI